MKLSVPRYLEASRCQTDPTFAWEDRWDVDRLGVSPDPELVGRLEGISQRAVLAFASGIAEWLVYRFEGRCDTSAPWNLVETSWAMNIHLKYCVGKECWSFHARKGWDGAVKRPIRRVLEDLEAGFYSLGSEYRTDPPRGVGDMDTLTSYVMSDEAASKAYKKWSGQVLRRFEALYPRDPEDKLGDVVPRQAIDPDLDFRVEQTETLINDFLSGVDYSNLFLNSADGVLEVFDDYEPFTGTPFVFDMEADRRARRAWASGIEP